MEPERERSGSTLKKGRKRRRIPSKLVGAAETISRWDLEERQQSVGHGFKTFGSAQRALNILTGKDWKLKGRHALTPRHLHAWLRDLPHESRLPGVRVIPPAWEQAALEMLKVDYPKIAAWHWGRKIGKLYHNLCSDTLCLILLPGTKSTDGSLSGLRLMRIKDEEESTTPNMCL